MTTAPKISLSQQIEAVDLAIARQRQLASSGSVKEMRPKSAAAYDVERLQAAHRSLSWLQLNYQQLHDFLGLPKEARDVLVARALELARAEALARTGGPVR